ncbi:hypothetical protein [Ruegeria sp. HKCCD8929]|uniref:hypothetical protein n=1 Tax=Ruegeria sp. HKCCD8929 TaxID=2683006 RepID=UPI001487BEBC|nr:hypothetical protein [Ruegeria sp. HKCCD8929]
MLDEKVVRLEGRIASLETYFKVGIIVAAIFGIGGGFGAYAVNTARSEVAALQTGVSELSSQIANLQSGIEAAENKLDGVTDELSDASAEHINSLNAAMQRHLNSIETASDDAQNKVVERSSVEQTAIGKSVAQEIAAQLSNLGSVRIHKASQITCDGRDKPVTGQFTEICRTQVDGDFPSGYTVMYSIPHFNHQYGEIPPVYSIGLDKNSDGFALVVKTAYGHLSELIVQYVVLSE